MKFSNNKYDNIKGSSNYFRMKKTYNLMMFSYLKKKRTNFKELVKEVNHNALSK